MAGIANILDIEDNNCFLLENNIVYVYTIFMKDKNMRK